jgi:hypothetical protein
MQTVELKKDEAGNLILPLDDQLMKEAGWEIGDTIEWIDNDDGSWTLAKKEKTKLVLVETVSSFRMRYVVEIPEDASEEIAHDFALNSEDVKEFSQKHVGEEVTGSYTIDDMHLLRVFDRDNSYLSSWNDAAKLESVVNKWGA